MHRQTALIVHELFFRPAKMASVMMDIFYFSLVFKLWKSYRLLNKSDPYECIQNKSKHSPLLHFHTSQMESLLLILYVILTGRVHDQYFRNISFPTGILIGCHKEGKDNTLRRWQWKLRKFKKLRLGLRIRPVYKYTDTRFR